MGDRVTGAGTGGEGGDFRDDVIDEWGAAEGVGGGVGPRDH
jgi:hypothetical protein